MKAPDADLTGYHQLYAFASTLRFLTPALIAQVDDAIGRAGPFGEVRLRLAKGRVRFIDCTISTQVAQEAL